MKVYSTVINPIPDEEGFHILNVIIVIELFIKFYTIV